jgi:hypothetical protein
VHCVVCHEQFASDGVARLHWTKAGHVHPSIVARLAGCEERHGLVWRRADGQGWERAGPYRPRAASTSGRISQAFNGSTLFSGGEAVQLTAASLHR